MKNKDILSLYEGISEIKTESYSVRVGFTFAKNLITLEPYYRAIKEQQQKLWEKYGEYNKDGDIIVPKNKISELNRENNELMEIETIVNISKIDLKDIEENALSIDKMMKIFPMIEEKP